MGGIASALLLAWAQITRNSWKNLLDDLSQEIIERVTREIKEVLNAQTRGIYFGNIVRKIMREVIEDELDRYLGQRDVRRRRGHSDNDV